MSSLSTRFTGSNLSNDLPKLSRVLSSQEQRAQAPFLKWLVKAGVTPVQSEAFVEAMTTQRPGPDDLDAGWKALSAKAGALEAVLRDIPADRLAKLRDQGLLPQQQIDQIFQKAFFYDGKAMPDFGLIKAAAPGVSLAQLNRANTRGNTPLMMILDCYFFHVGRSDDEKKNEAFLSLVKVLLDYGAGQSVGQLNEKGQSAYSLTLGFFNEYVDDCLLDLLLARVPMARTWQKDDRGRTILLKALSRRDAPHYVKVLNRILPLVPDGVLREPDHEGELPIFALLDCCPDANVLEFLRIFLARGCGPDLGVLDAKGLPLLKRVAERPRYAGFRGAPDADPEVYRDLVFQLLETDAGQHVNWVDPKHKNVLAEFADICPEPVYVEVMSRLIDMASDETLLHRTKKRKSLLSRLLRQCPDKDFPLLFEKLHSRKLLPRLYAHRGRFYDSIFLRTLEKLGQAGGKKYLLHLNWLIDEAWPVTPRGVSPRARVSKVSNLMVLCRTCPAEDLPKAYKMLKQAKACGDYGFCIENWQSVLSEIVKYVADKHVCLLVEEALEGGAVNHINLVHEDVMDGGQRKTPLDLAKARGYRPLIALFKAHGAKTAEEVAAIEAKFKLPEKKALVPTPPDRNEVFNAVFREEDDDDL